MNATIRRIADIGGIARRLDPEEFVYHQGGEVGTIYVLQSGAIRLARLTLSGLEIATTEIRVGDCFGEGEVVMGLDYRESFAQAVRPSEVLPIALRELSASNMAELRQLAIERLFRSHVCLAEMLAEPPTRRVANLLRFLSADAPTIELTQDELGRRAACSRETVSKALKHFQEVGAIAIKRTVVTVLKPDRLGF